jgi:parvulin-like peptidyl-prolyl isomerase
VIHLAKKYSVTISSSISVLLYVLFIPGCIPNIQNRDIIAYVDNEPITRKDIRYSLQIAHRREDLSSARDLNISEYLDKLINQKLIAQEARRMGLDKNTRLQKAVNAFITSESVVMLYNEEIVGRVTVTEEDIRSHYTENYERFTLGVIETDSRDNADEMAEKLKNGSDFMKLAADYSARLPGIREGRVTLRRNRLMPFMEESVPRMQPGGHTEVIEANNRFFIIKVLAREEALPENFEKNRAELSRTVRKRKEDERGELYLQQLREQASVEVNTEILSFLKSGEWEKERETWLKDERTLAEVNGSVLMVKTFLKMNPPRMPKPLDKLLQNWINTKVVDHEALKRGYNAKPPLKDSVNRYQNRLLIRAFNQSMIVPKIVITDTELRKYYGDHQDNYLEKPRYRIQQITLKTEEAGRKTLDSLHKNASFSWLAKTTSLDTHAHKGGDRGWVEKDVLPESAKAIIDSLEPGEISPVIKSGDVFIILRLQEKSKSEPRKFEDIKDIVQKAYYTEKFRKIYDTYIERLKQEAIIEIDSDVMMSFEKTLNK